MKVFGAIFSLVVVAMSVSSSLAAEPFRDCPDCPLMVTVPGGEVVIESKGAANDHRSDARKLSRVSVRKFSLGLTEVTRDQFAAFVSATGYQANVGCVSASTNGWVELTDADWQLPGFSQGGDHPVVCVDWADATAYVRWLAQITGKNYRLPTGAEWAYAARAGAASASDLGSAPLEACFYANVMDVTLARTLAHLSELNLSDTFPCADGYVYTAPGAQFRPNAFGLHDMMGNVLEMTENCLLVELAGECLLSDFSVTFIDRGGSWYDPADLAVKRTGGGRCGSCDPDETGSHIGFRVARTD